MKATDPRACQPYDMPNPTVRPATLADVAFLTHLMWLGHLAEHPEAPELPPDTWTELAEADTRAQVQGQVENSTTSVIELNTEPVGRLRVIRTAERHILAGIQLAPAHRNQGVGTTIITTLLQEARDGSVPLDLTVSKNNPNAERLYTRLGFHRTGENGNDHVMRSL